MSSQSPSQPDQDGFRPSLGSDKSKLKTQNSQLCFVCVGAGRSSRFGGDKLGLKLGGRTVFSTALGALEAAFPAAGMIVVVASKRLAFWIDRLGLDFPRARCVAGGAHRHESVRAGVMAAIDLGAEVVAVHDAARPLVDPRDVQRVVGDLGDADGAVLTGRVSDTVKRIDGNDMVVETVDREGLRLALTPQVFRVSSLQFAWEEMNGSGEWTDESAILESLGMRVRSVVCRYPNPKLTVPSDLRVIRALAGVTP